jgi:hypothetical protein
VSFWAWLRGFFVRVDEAWEHELRQPTQRQPKGELLETKGPDLFPGMRREMRVCPQCDVVHGPVPFFVVGDRCNDCLAKAFDETPAGPDDWPRAS